MLWHAINGATKEAILVGATELGPLSPKIRPSQTGNIATNRWAQFEAAAT
ncbi:MAG: hypothetical protein R2854_08125 [Caldilineaceae bacterium]